MHTPDEQNYLDLPDDEIMNMSAPAPGVAAPAATAVDETQVDDPETPAVDLPGSEGEQPPAGEEEQDDDQGETPEAKAEREAAEREAANQAILGAPDDKLVPPTPAAPAAPKAEDPKVDPPAAAPVAKVDDPAADPAKTPAAPLVNYADYSPEQKASILDGLMAFKANGKEIKLNSPEELKKLAQMGANYTKNMQLLQPMKRLFKMLDNNKLTDPAQLSYLIDLHQKKPEAIQKLLADSKFDPHTVDTEKAAQYKPGAHQVSDLELEFEAVLQDVEQSETGPELLSEVTQQWDPESRRALFQQPRLLAELNSQKAMGFYGKITAEMEHRKMLGTLQGVPFLQAYELVGKDLHAKGLLWPLDNGQAPAPTTDAPVVPEPQKREPVATRVATPAKKVVNSDKAAAATAPKAGPTAVKTEVNYLDMPDDDFLKQMNGRL